MALSTVKIIPILRKLVLSLPTQPPKSMSMKLWQGHLSLAKQVVKDYCLRAELKEDAIQEAQLALWEATMSWDEAMADTFSHYAWLVMRRKLLIYLTQKATDRPRLSKNEQEVMNSIRKNLSAGQMITCRAIDLLSEETGVSRFRLTQLISFWYSSRMSLTASSMVEIDSMASDGDIEHEEKVLTLLDQSILKLPEREQEVIRERLLKDPKKTLGELAAVYGISKERVRQIEENGLKKLRKSLSHLSE